MDSEASLLLSYAMSASGTRWRPAPADEERYRRAVQLQVSGQHRLDPIVYKLPFLLGGLDIVSRLLYPSSLLQQKLIVALALVEYHPASAGWLLPRDRSKLTWLCAVALLCLRVLLKALVGLPLLLFRGFFARNVGPI